jgi:hypothetical protein
MRLLRKELIDTLEIERGPDGCCSDSGSATDITTP